MIKGSGFVKYGSGLPVTQILTSANFNNANKFE
jgi:hypothetical protein